METSTKTGAGARLAFLRGARRRLIVTAAAVLVAVLAFVLGGTLGGTLGGGGLTATSDSASGGSGGSGGFSALAPEVGLGQDGPSSPPSGGISGDATSVSRAASGSATTGVGGVANRGPAQQQAVIARGQVVLSTKHLTDVRRTIEQLLDQWGGALANEQATSDPRGRPSYARLVLRVPQTRFADAMDRLGTLGRVESSSRSERDVTTRVIDTAVRVRAQKKSLERIEQLLAQAKSLGQVVSIESELTRRQAELDSLERTQAYLADQTSMSTITVYLERTGTASPRPGDQDGFVVGLRHGWNALTGLLVGALTVLGTLLPFLALALLLGVPAWAALRRLQRRPARRPQAANGGAAG